MVLKEKMLEHMQNIYILYIHVCVYDIYQSNFKLQYKRKRKRAIFFSLGIYFILLYRSGGIVPVVVVSPSSYINWYSDSLFWLKL